MFETYEDSFQLRIICDCFGEVLERRRRISVVAEAMSTQHHIFWIAQGALRQEI